MDELEETYNDAKKYGGTDQEELQKVYKKFIENPSELSKEFNKKWELGKEKEAETECQA